jgi:hypothetical protein
MTTPDLSTPRACPYCKSVDVLTEDGGPRNSWRGYTFCGDCGETIGRKWRRKIDDFCQRQWGVRPNRTRALTVKGSPA